MSRWLNDIAGSYRAQVKLCLAVMLFAAAMMHFVFLPHTNSVKIYSPASDVSEPVPERFPISVHTRYGEVRIVKILMEYQSWQHSYFRLLPVGCVQKIEVNGESLPVDKYKSCHPTRGLLIDYAPYLKPGTNEIDVTLMSGGIGGMDFGPELFASDIIQPAGLMAVLFMFGFAGLFASRLSYRGINKTVCAMFFLSVLFHIWQQHRMTYGQFANDWEGHVDYVRAISARLWWPAPYEGWVFYHPPFFYTLMALVQRAAAVLSSFNIMVMVRFVSFVFYVFFLYYGVRTLYVMIGNERIRTWMSAMLLFWPVSLLLGGRLDSHSLYYALYMVAVYYLTLGMKNQNLRQVFMAVGLAGCALAIRSNVLVLFAVLALVLLDVLLREGREWPRLRSWFKMRALWLMVLVVLIGASLNFGRSYYYRVTEERTEPLIVGNVHGNNPATRITRTEPSDYLLLDLKSYFASPAWDIGYDYGFWNAYLKSSIYGAFPSRWIAFTVTLQTLLLGIWAVAFYQLLAMRKQKHRLRVLYGSLLIVPALAMMVHRYLHPFGASQDVRYVYPMIVTLIGLFGLALERWQARGEVHDELGHAAKISVAGIKCLIAVFVFCAVAMYVTQWYLTKQWLSSLPDDVEISSLVLEPHGPMLRLPPAHG